MERLSGLVPSGRIRPVVPLETDYGYRTKSHMPAGGTGRSLELGFWAPRSRELVVASSCVVQADPVEAARHNALQALRDAGVAAWDAVTGQGELRSLLVRSVNSTDSQCQVGIVLVVSASGTRDWNALAAAWVEQGWVHAVWLNIHSEPTNAMLGPETKHLAGLLWLEQRVGDVLVYRGATAFTQSSELGERILTQLVAEVLPEQIEHCFDLYAGAGIFTAALLSRIASGVLVERVNSGVWAAEKTFADRPDITMHSTAVEDCLPSLLRVAPSSSVVVVDPPRMGLHAVVTAALCSHPVANIAYVSCNPQTLERDLEVLVNGPYEVDEVIPVDMFPHTPHLEVVVHLKAKSG